MSKALPRLSDHPDPLKRMGFDSYEEYLRSRAWGFKRRAILDRDNHLCPCGNPAVQVHHLTYKRIGCERTSDLISVCRECHERIHFEGSDDVRSATLHTLGLKHSPKREPWPWSKQKAKPKRTKGKPRLTVQQSQRRIVTREMVDNAPWRVAKREFVPFRPVVGGGLPVTKVKADGSVERHTQAPPSAAVRPSRKRRRNPRG